MKHLDRVCTGVLSVVALVFGVLDHSPAIWSGYAFVVAVAGVAWLALHERTAGLLRSAGRDSMLAVAAVVGALLAVRVLPPGWAVMVPLAVVVGAYAWSTPARRTVPPAAACVLGVGWLAQQTSGHPIVTAGDFLAFAAAAALILGGAWFFCLAALRSLRVVWRHAGALVAAALVVAVAVPFVRGLNPLNFASLGLVLVVAACAFGAVRAAQARRRATERERTRPMQVLGEHVAGLIGWRGKDADALFAVEGERTIVRQWPTDPDAAGAVIACRYQKGWHGSDAALRQVERVAGQCQGGEWVATLDVGRRHVVLTRQAVATPLPKRLDHADLTGGRDLVPLGVRGDGNPLTWDLSHHVHALVVGITNSGKTNATRIIVATIAGSGGLVDVIDPKYGDGDYDAFEGLPNVRVHGHIAGQVETLFAYRAEMDHRRALPRDSVERRALPRRVLVVDECLEFLTSAKDHLPRRRSGDPDPVLVALKAVVTMARSVDMRLVMGTQQATVDAIGGTQIRNNLGFRLALGKVSSSNTGALFDAPPPPVDDKVRGRGVVQDDGEFTAVQIAYLTEAKARQIASTGAARFPAPEARPAPEPAPTTTTAPPPRPADTRQHTPQHTETDGLRARARWADTDTRTHAPEQAPPATGQPVTCHRCGHAWTTTAKPGSSVRCPQPDCRHSRRVPAARKDAA